MFYQGSLLANDAPSLGPADAIERVALDAGSWIDVAPAWLNGADAVFEQLVVGLAWRQRRDIAMYDRLVDEPRLTAGWRRDDDVGAIPPVLFDVGAVLSDRYRVDFDSIGFNLYRDGADSVAWHGDRHRRTVQNPIVAIVSVGAARPFRLRPRVAPSDADRDGGRARAPARTWPLGRGDLLVMGGSCQHDWEHCVPKVASAGPRISITYRHGT